MMYTDVVLNKYGFYTLKNHPADEERKAYYRNQYYQDNKATYTSEYANSELDFINIKLEQKLLLIEKHLSLSPTCSFLDIGCGEGFAVSFFKKRGFTVLGLDYSSAGIKNHNLDVLDDAIIGDVYDSITNLVTSSKCFDIVNMDNVLEHVTAPKELLELVYKVLTKNGIIIIKVPNDFSVLQHYFIENKIASKPHWVAPLDHISYFNKEGLINLSNAVGFKCIDFLSDQMIEFSALNPNTNYFENKNVGKSCHFARVAQENIFHKISPQKTIEMYRILGSMGLGWEIIGIFAKEQSP